MAGGSVLAQRQCGRLRLVRGSRRRLRLIRLKGTRTILLSSKVRVVVRLVSDKRKAKPKAIKLIVSSARPKIKSRKPRSVKQKGQTGRQTKRRKAVKRKPRQGNKKSRSLERSKERSNRGGSMQRQKNKQVRVQGGRPQAEAWMYTNIQALQPHTEPWVPFAYKEEQVQEAVQAADLPMDTEPHAITQEVDPEENVVVQKNGPDEGEYVADGDSVPAWRKDSDWLIKAIQRAKEQEGMTQIVFIRNSEGIVVELASLQAAINLQDALQLAITLLLSFTLANDEALPDVSSQLIQSVYARQSQITVIEIEDSRDVKVNLVPAETNASIQVLLQILLSLAEKLGAA